MGLQRTRRVLVAPRELEARRRRRVGTQRRETWIWVTTRPWRRRCPLKRSCKRRRLLRRKRRRKIRRVRQRQQKRRRSRLKRERLKRKKERIQKLLAWRISSRTTM